MPVPGLAIAIYGSLGGNVPDRWVPVVVGMIVFPFARNVDKLRQK